jgi:GH35 family endo-1,4-beta-xylanase
MFNTYKTDNSYRGPDKISVTEKKAPTDESIRLLNEMQEKAFDNIVECVQLSNNELNDVTYWMYPDHYSFSEKARIRFKLNGKVKDFEFTFPHKYTDKAEIQRLIMEKIYMEISKDIFNGFIDKNLTKIIEIYKR